MNDQEGHQQGLGIDLCVCHLAVLEKLLAVIRGEDQRCFVRQSQSLQLHQESPQHVVYIPDRGVIHGAEVLHGFGADLHITLVDLSQVLATGIKGRGRRIRPEHSLIPIRRLIRIVDTVGVQEQKEAVVVLERPEELQAPVESTFDVRIGSVCRIGELVKTPAESVSTGHETAFGVSRRAEPMGLEMLG